HHRGSPAQSTSPFLNRKGFTHTVLDPASRGVIGCVYIDPLPNSDHDACALSWGRESHAHMDEPLWRAASEWFEADWPFGAVDYAPARLGPPRQRFDQLPTAGSGMNSRIS